MWLSKPIYEVVPYFYLLAGCIALAASLYLDYWYWPSICFVVGMFSLLGGIVVHYHDKILDRSVRRGLKNLTEALRAKV